MLKVEEPTKCGRDLSVPSLSARLFWFFLLLDLPLLPLYVDC
jgi:hypothetical protein